MKHVNPKITTSAKEIKDLIVAWIVISIAFGIVLRPAGSSIVSTGALGSMAIAALTVGVGFLLHELAHKVVAQKYRCWAEFRANKMMLVLALLMSFFGFVFAAPGAVMIFGRVTRRQNGLISVAGPMTNIALAIIFFALSAIGTGGFLGRLFHIGGYVNAFLALFNMLPFGVFDGKKVYNWSKRVFYSVLGLSLIVFFISLF